MSSLSRELVFLILQFLDEEKFKETVHKYAQFYICIFVVVSVSFVVLQFGRLHLIWILI